MSSSTLTTKQAKWLDEYLACGNATASAVRAGFSSKGASVAGSRMLRNVRVQEALQAQQKADAARLSLRREDVLAGLLDAAAMAKLHSDPAGMVASWKQIGLLLGFYNVKPSKLEISVAGTVAINQLARMSDAELIKMIDGRALQ